MATQWGQYSDEELERMAGRAPRGNTPVVIPLPTTPQKQREERRQERGDQRDEIRTGISQSGEDRAGRNEQRDVTKQDFDFAKNLRADFDGQQAVKEYRIVMPIFSQGLRTSGDPEGDLALVYAYSKVMDPTSVVREGEAAAVANVDTLAGQTFQRLQKELNRAGSFTPAARENLRREMLNKAAQLNKAYNNQRTRFKADAEFYNVDPARVIGPHDGGPFKREVLQYFKNNEGDDAALAFADAGASEKSIPIPEQMQAEYAERLKTVRTPEEYAALRAELDSKFGFAKNTPDQMEANRQYYIERKGRPIPRIPPANAKMQMLDRLNNSAFDNPIGAAVMSAPAAAPWMDEISGGFRSIINGTPYEVERDIANATKQGMQDKYPVSSVLGALGGGALGGGAVAKYAPRAAAWMTANVPRIMGSGAVGGAIAGAGEDNANRLRGAGVGAAFGGGGAAAGKYGGEALERVTRPRSARLNKMDVALGDVPIDRIRRNVTDAQDLGIPYMLADATPQTRNLTGSAVRFSPKAREMAEKRLGTRQSERGERAVMAIRENLSEPVDIAARQDELYEAGSIAAEPFYEAVFSKPVTISKEMDALMRTQKGREALREAYKIAEMEGRNPSELGFIMDENGAVSINGAGFSDVVRQPTFRTIDLVKRGIDAVVEKKRNPVTGRIDTRRNPALQALEGFRKTWIRAADKIDPEYKTARAEYEKFAKQAEQLDRGYNAFGRNVVPRDMQRGLQGLGDDDLAQYRAGYATRATDEIAKSERGDPLELFYGKTGSQTSQRRAKVGTLWPEAIPRLDRLSELEGDMARTYNEVVGNSFTQPRAVADAQFAERTGELGTNAAIDLATGSPGIATGMGVTRRVLQNIADRRNLGGAATERKAEEMAPVLLGDNPVDVLSYLDDLERRQREVAMRRAQYQRIGGLLGLTAGTGAAGY